MPYRITRQPEIIPRPINEVSRINIDARRQESPPINRMEVHVENADASWAPNLTDSRMKLADSSSPKTSRNYPLSGASKDNIEPPLRERPTVFADQVPAGIAERYGWVRVTRAKPLNPKFIQNAPVPGYSQKELAHNPAAHLAA